MSTTTTGIRELAPEEIELTSGGEVNIGPFFGGTFDNGFYVGIQGVGVLWVGGDQVVVAPWGH
jgi:hypothetical protein